MKYLLNLSELILGDIILIKTNDSTCVKIRKISKSNYSHALIYRGNYSCLESHAFGVQSLNPQRLLFDNLDDAIVLRLKDKSIRNNLEIGLTKAASKIGMSYASVREVMKSYLDTLENAQEVRRQFCTRFVAQLYEESGVAIVANSDYCSPLEIENSEFLEVVKSSIKQATQKEIELAEQKDSVLEIQKESIYNFFEGVRSSTNVDLQTFDNVDEFLKDNPEFDKVFNELLIDSKFLELGTLERSKNILMYNTDTFIKHYGIKQCINVSRREIHNELIRIQNFELAAEKYYKLYEEHNLKYFLSHRDCYEKQVEFSKERLNVFQSILSL